MIAVYLQSPAVVWPTWLVLLGAGAAVVGLAAFVRYFEWNMQKRSSAKRVAIAALLALVLSTSHVQAVYFTNYYPCTAENWAWLSDNMHYVLALTVWYGAYGCF